MDTLTLIVVALATGAAEQARGTGEKVVVEGYTALKHSVIQRYGVVEAEVAGLESEPDELLRRQLLVKKLGHAGAGADESLREAAEQLLRLVAERAPGAAVTVGVQLTRVAVNGDIEIVDVAAESGSAVAATGVTAGDGSLSVSGARVAEVDRDLASLARERIELPPEKLDEVMRNLRSSETSRVAWAYKRLGSMAFEQEMGSCRKILSTIRRAVAGVTGSTYRRIHLRPARLQCFRTGRPGPRRRVLSTGARALHRGR
ncbi:hypothetical protein LBW94_039265 [Nocardia sp. alder85J]|nr:hypothetical protein [Nocardia sp. alder85J]MCX4098393.1 hypothetical protein [Nocardia sp. alder85J]